jgi:hypothetical protein
VGRPADHPLPGLSAYPFSRPGISSYAWENDSILNIWNISSGTAIRIVKTFRDYHGGEFTAGTILHFDHRDYLPYHSGHTVFFKERFMYLCDLDDTSNRASAIRRIRPSSSRARVLLPT